MWVFWNSRPSFLLRNGAHRPLVPPGRKHIDGPGVVGPLCLGVGDNGLGLGDFGATDADLASAILRDTVEAKSAATPSLSVAGVVLWVRLQSSIAGARCITVLIA